jgi:hypothetical protein
MNGAGICESYVMPPLQPLPEENKEALRKNWQQLIEIEAIEL